ncbi:hypothetical protein [Paraburkholderia bryophila]|uniref:Metal ABC transporter ATPase n=3 Tax=Paraburkholderia TaxID=1822464 RepID=A0A7Y9WIT8_9BURK|nr:hypothetical protein [Paraburkholderia bryophila]NYH19928.1 hypothetical protein [Paraburkholderia bryophila]NYH21043.1 hypothetical protein [Paraburkholderia bryophila]
MGVGMQIVYLGFAGTVQIEAEAASQLVRLERFSQAISGCHLAIESIRATKECNRVDGGADEARGPLFDARLDLIMHSGELVPIRHCLNADAEVAIHAAFDSAEAQLARTPGRQRS